MNRRIINYVLGQLFIVESVLLMFPLLVSFIYQEGWRYHSSYLYVIIFLITVGFLLSHKKPQGLVIRARDGAVIVALSWILFALFGGMPLVLSGDIPSIVDAFFEIVSGFTTTGSSILKSLSPLAKSTLFWRSFTHLIGGMGVLVFALAVLPDSKSDTVYLMRSEVPGPVFSKIVAKLKDTSRILYGIYLVMTAIFVIVLMIGGVPLFDALLLSFGTAGTGGFAINDLGFAVYSNPVFVEYAIAIGMLIFGINFNLYFLLLMGYVKDVFKDEELRYYLGIVAMSVMAITLSLAPSWQKLEETFRHVLFSVSSIITTTGYATVDFAQWGLVGQLILLLLMFVGGCAGSTAGGMKVSRIVMYVKEAIAGMYRLGHVNRVVVMKFNGSAVSQKELAKLTNYLQIYILIFIVLLFCVSFEAPDFLTAFSSVAGTFNNIGPGLSAVGPTANFSFYSDLNKIMLSLGMIAGRLELYAMIILLAPSTWKKLLSRQ